MKLNCICVTCARHRRQLRTDKFMTYLWVAGNVLLIGGFFAAMYFVTIVGCILSGHGRDVCGL